MGRFVFVRQGSCILKWEIWKQQRFVLRSTSLDTSLTEKILRKVFETA